MHLFGKDYEYVKKGRNGKFLIDGKDGSVYRDQSFYKYYALDDYSVDALTHLYVYAAHPCQFNDPFDCDEDLINFDDMDCIRIFWDHLFTKVVELCNNDVECIKKFTNLSFKTYLYTKWGIICLSQKYDNLPMWSAYTNHKGFCLEFDISRFPFKMVGPFPVNYQKQLKTHSIKEISIQLATIVQTNVKQNIWEYEHEWRLLLECPQDFIMEPFGEKVDLFKSEIHDFHDRKFKYPLHCLKSVCLGMKFFNGMQTVISDYEDEVIAINDIQNEVLSFLALSKIPTYILSKVDFGLERTPIQIIRIRENAYRITCLIRKLGT